VGYEPDVQELVAEPWTVEIRAYPQGGYFAKVVELPGCMTEADTREEVLDAIDDALVEWLSVAIEAGDPIPRPRTEGEYSGKIFVRTSHQLHQAVSEQAARAGVSMSQWISELLSREVGFATHAASPAHSRELQAVAKEIRVLRMTLAHERHRQAAIAHHVSRWTGLENLPELVSQHSAAETSWRRLTKNVPKENVVHTERQASLRLVAGAS
jgi:antitoxin HicB